MTIEGRGVQFEGRGTVQWCEEGFLVFGCGRFDSFVKFLVSKDVEMGSFDQKISTDVKLS